VSTCPTQWAQTPMSASSPGPRPELPGAVGGAPSVSAAEAPAASYGRVRRTCLTHPPQRAQDYSPRPRGAVNIWRLLGRGRQAWRCVRGRMIAAHSAGSDTVPAVVPRRRAARLEQPVAFAHAWRVKALWYTYQKLLTTMYHWYVITNCNSEVEHWRHGLFLERVRRGSRSATEVHLHPAAAGQRPRRQ
jgi:hypothetical protein